MVEFLFEILCEEIPARMQDKAGQDLERLMILRLEAAGLTVKDPHHWVGPRRLGFVAHIPKKSPDVTEERKGPRINAPEPALLGFMRAAGLSDIKDAEIRSDKKGEFYVARLEKSGQDAADIIKDVIPALMSDFPWPKSMKSAGSNFRWVRPLSRLLCLIEGQPVPVTVDGWVASNITEGHRRHGRGPFTIKSYEDYKQVLEGLGHVMLEAPSRRAKIERDAHKLCQKAGLELVEDAGLLSEVVGLAEWPCVILAEMQPDFLALPAELIRLSMRTHQKYFAVRDPKTGQLAPYFILVANQEAPDGGQAIAAGNSRVLSARLSDAQFFQSEDTKRRLIDYYDKLDTVVFHKKLGSMKDKSERVEKLARQLAPEIGAEPEVAAEAARLSKCDLVTQTVVEFTSLQGHIGRLMYEREGGDASIALAIEDHYRPQGPRDDIPNAPISMTVALADKFDTLINFWAIDEKPTGSKDPYALRRAALGIVRIILDNNIRMSLRRYIENDDLLAFLIDRLKVYLRDEGIRHDLIDAVFALGGDDLVSIVGRVRALQSFLDTQEGENLLAGYKRAANILKAEARKGALPDGTAKSGTDTAEIGLFQALEEVEPTIEAALGRENYAEAMSALSHLRSPIDRFFDEVMVNDPDTQKRDNRLGLLRSICQTADQIADFSVIEG